MWTLINHPVVLKSVRLVRFFSRSHLQLVSSLSPSARATFVSRVTRYIVTKIHAAALTLDSESLWLYVNQDPIVMVLQYLLLETNVIMVL